MIKHVSFDVWGTLISANPEFAAARTDFLSREFNINLATVKAAYTKVKRRVDVDAEVQGMAYATDAVYELLYNELGLALTEAHHCKIRSRVEQLFLQHPPTITDATKNQIAHLRSKGITLSIGSNSNFISGKVMLPFLQREFDNAFAFGVFSDLHTASKPHCVFFDEVIFLAGFHSVHGVHANEILHVGDNYICDGIGPAESGMPYVILNDVNDIQPAFRHLAFLFREDN